jgi:hypothetical protein
VDLLELGVLKFEFSDRLYNNVVEGWRFFPKEASDFSVPPPAL